MKRLLGLVCVLLVALGTAAQTKVIEKSAKKPPVWLNTAVDDYLVVTVTANSLADAQTKAMDEITERIIQSVASHVMVTTNSELSEVNVNGNIDSRESFRRASKMKSANLPFLKGISSTKVEEIYWVKLQDKSTKKEHYEYSVKYPFSQAEQNELVAQFEALDAEKVAQYEALEQKINEIESVEEIGSCITQLDALIAPNDLAASYLMRELMRRGLRIPDDIAVAGFDNEPFSGSLYPSLTTIDDNNEEIGKYAFDLLLEQLNEKKTSVHHKHSVCVVPRIVWRESI